MDVELRQAIRDNNKLKERIIRWRLGEDVGFEVGDLVEVTELVDRPVIVGTYEAVIGSQQETYRGCLTVDVINLKDAVRSYHYAEHYLTLKEIPIFGQDRMLLLEPRGIRKNESLEPRQN